MADAMAIILHEERTPGATPLGLEDSFQPTTSPDGALQEVPKGGGRIRRWLVPGFRLPFSWLRSPRWLLAILLLSLLVFGVVLLGRRLWARHELQVGRAELERYLSHG